MFVLKSFIYNGFYLNVCTSKKGTVFTVMMIVFVKEKLLNDCATMVCKRVLFIQ